MSDIVIVAIPAEDDPVWKVSSEKVPHLTLCFLEGPFKNEENTVRFIEHAVSTSLSRFGLSTDRRGPLGPDDADVLFFDKRNGGKELLAFRAFLLTDKDIFTCYQKAPQYPIWTPHLTLGYPATPAKEMPEHGIHWVNFDRIAVWTEDYAGPEFQLKENRDMEVDLPEAWSDQDENFLEHFGVRGMRWGVRRPTNSSGLVTGSVSSAIKSGQTPKAGGSNPGGKKGKSQGSADHQRMVKNLNKKVENLSTRDIKELSQRIKAVNDLKATTDAQKAAQRSLARRIVGWAGTQVKEGARREGERFIQEQTGGVLRGLLPKINLPNSNASPKSSPGASTVKPRPQPSPPQSPERQKAIEELVYNVTTLREKGG